MIFRTWICVFCKMKDKATLVTLCRIKGTAQTKSKWQHIGILDNFSFWETSSQRTMMLWKEYVWCMYVCKENMSGAWSSAVLKWIRRDKGVSWQESCLRDACSWACFLQQRQYQHAKPAGPWNEMPRMGFYSYLIKHFRKWGGQKKDYSKGGGDEEWGSSSCLDACRLLAKSLGLWSGRGRLSGRQTGHGTATHHSSVAQPGLGLLCCIARCSTMRSQHLGLPDYATEGGSNCNKTRTKAAVWGPFLSLLSSCDTIYCVLDLYRDVRKLLVACHIQVLETLLPDASSAALLTAAGNLTAC